MKKKNSEIKKENPQGSLTHPPLNKAQKTAQFIFKGVTKFRSKDGFITIMATQAGEKC
jgi:hypothetical protein